MGCVAGVKDAGDDAFDLYSKWGYIHPNIEISCTHKGEYGYIESYLSNSKENLYIIEKCKLFNNYQKCVDNTECKFVCNDSIY